MICRGSHPILISSKSYATWHEEQLWRLKNKEIRKQVPTRVKSMTLRFYFPDCRKTDLSNKAESIMDLFVDSGLLADDNWTIVPKLILESGGVDRVNPRVEIEFK